jgi:DnaJ-class molecular chaperone
MNARRYGEGSQVKTLEKDSCTRGKNTQSSRSVPKEVGGMQEHEEELEECWECDGTGEVWENEDGETDVLPIDCPHCDGEGRTYNE